MKFLALVGPEPPHVVRRPRRLAACCLTIVMAAAATPAAAALPGVPVPVVGKVVETVSDTVQGVQTSPPVAQVVTPVVSAVPVVPEVVNQVATTSNTVVDTVSGVVTPTAGGGGDTTSAGRASTATQATSTPSTSSPGGSSGAEQGSASQPAAADSADVAATSTASASTTDPVTGSGALGAPAQTSTGAGASPSTIPASAQSDPVIPQPSRSDGVVAWIVEVTPAWAQALICGLMLALLGAAFASYRRLRRRAAEDRYRSLHDPLTDLPNRALFVDRVDEALSSAGEGERLAVMLIDLNDFKEVNDTLGHRNGDELLRQVADRMAGTIREPGTVARLGGDEFAVLIPGVTGEAHALRIATALRHALRVPFPLDGLSVHSDASVGIALSPDHGVDTDTLIQRADVAMYLAKAGRTGAAVYDPARDHYRPERLALIGELRHAIARDELSLYYQPQIEPRTGRVRGVEALIRWNHPTRGLVPPDEFIPLAERTGLIAPLTAWVLNAAARQCATWRGKGLNLWVAANLSAANLTDGETPAVVEELLRRWKLPPGAFRLEITETTAMADPEHTRAVLDRLDDLGVELAIDDFGTGYSSLSYLKRLPVHELKIDRSFVSKMATDTDDETIVSATIEMAHSLGLRVVAEGVEDVETLEELRRRGCDLAQGYLFSKPLPPKDLEAWLHGLRRRATEAGTPSQASPLALGA